ncbi:MAG: polysaccharide biosynthesis protein GtrA [Sphingobacteriales bacterium]|nr:polysaccharide biosynthesis protein GtrA [Sphingobacteriales bacterium]
MNVNHKKNALFIFAKAQTVSFIGGLADYALMISLTEWAHIHYTISIMISGIIGALINFNLNRSWTYMSDRFYATTMANQLVKFSFVVAVSIASKSFGTYLLTSRFAINYKISRLMVELLVCYAFNFPLMKYWVFKNEQRTQKLTT